ncbi:DUF397 domain-containing protein [Streptomyces sp. SID3343]|uniref:DUF397 domain-containing protein n=1 Tax=Streptomyces sp. SID3343 TaxID=2690260 RepID=UPI0031F8DDC1
MNASGPIWRTSSYSAHQGECVEVASLHPDLAVRDSKDRARGKVRVAPAAWQALLNRVQAS